jgi:hypothetical protein
MDTKEMFESLLGGFVILVVALALFPTLNGFVNSLYESSAVNASTGFAHSSQGLIPVIPLIYLVSIVLVSVGLVATGTLKSERLGSFSDKLSKLIIGFIVIVVGIALAVVLLTFGQSAYTSLSGYTWGSNISGLVQIVFLLYIVAIIVVGAVEMARAFMD